MLLPRFSQRRCPARVITASRSSPASWAMSKVPPQKRAVWVSPLLPFEAVTETVPSSASIWQSRVTCLGLSSLRKSPSPPHLVLTTPPAGSILKLLPACGGGSPVLTASARTACAGGLGGSAVFRFPVSL